MIEGELRDYNHAIKTFLVIFGEFSGLYKSDLLRVD